MQLTCGAEAERQGASLEPPLVLLIPDQGGDGSKSNRARFRPAHTLVLLAFLKVVPVQNDLEGTQPRKSTQDGCIECTLSIDEEEQVAR